MAGVPFESIERLATPKTSAAARELFVRQEEFTKWKTEVDNVLRSRRHGLSKELFRAWHKAIRSGIVPLVADPASGAFAICWNCASELAIGEKIFDETIESELGRTRNSLLGMVRTLQPPHKKSARARTAPSLIPPAYLREERHVERIWAGELGKVRPTNTKSNAGTDTWNRQTRIASRTLDGPRGCG